MASLPLSLEMTLRKEGHLKPLEMTEIPLGTLSSPSHGFVTSLTLCSLSLFLHEAERQHNGIAGAAVHHSSAEEAVEEGWNRTGTSGDAAVSTEGAAEVERRRARPREPQRRAHLGSHIGAIGTERERR
jgi:hypothetical protein